MNFLSHYYFDRDTTNCYFILGTVLPDLLKNADKTIILHPEHLVHSNPNINGIIQGWNKHLLVDKYFHSAEFFLTHSHTLKNLLAPVITESPVKPFFLGHIAIELILDNLLITTNAISVSQFYDHLDDCEPDVIRDFLVFAGLKNSDVFFKFYEEFKRSRYLNTYINIEQITYALKRICMRVWRNPFTPQQEAGMTGILLNYRLGLINSFMDIYDEIGQQLDTSAK
ncbi:hypothetical protein [Mucilaginibacter phyllosphaerae]|uniref:DUF479 domain-containing protein n=1 Tax=Mucilaginibacter phyllosphaerae TaxID=1812349 RepID=A0A4Y8A817_9SPHI|nr:hypothetical protein [Mucilaginibacter phyllosphaerae]MBB3970540.1 hypothetical protein [Mucilaginibacter phyllosphaerae]TEW64552.1 hypothetical protein E2R65_16155 [Mucilaginibacter phyllosphaerae]GGH19416.1 hypothetical protein GCM10007352_30750 [Mucilaginibacter phyllosphaerae]